MRLRCLIVDDNPRFGDEASRLLESEGITIVGVGASADEAVRLAESLAPDLALVDIKLGEESGFDVAGRLVNGSKAPHPAVILISIDDEEDFRTRISSSAALGFIPKTQLSAERIHQLLTRQRAARKVTTARTRR